MHPIGEVQKLTNLTARQIRYYEQLGLITPTRTAGRQRLFSDQDVERLQLIDSMHRQGLPLATIKVKLQQSADRPAHRLQESDAHLRLQKTGLTSLYPISNRAELQRFIDTKKREEEA